MSIDGTRKSIAGSLPLAACVNVDVIGSICQGISTIRQQHRQNRYGNAGLLLILALRTVRIASH